MTLDSPATPERIYLGDRRAPGDGGRAENAGCYPLPEPRTRDELAS